MLFELYKNTYRAFITIPSHFVGAFGVGCDSGRPEVARVTPDVLPNINEVGRRGERDLFVCIWPWRFFDDGYHLETAQVLPDVW